MDLDLLVHKCLWLLEDLSFIPELLWIELFSRSYNANKENCSQSYPLYPIYPEIELDWKPKLNKVQLDAILAIYQQ